MMAALHFGVAIRLAPATAAAVLEAIGDRSELPLQLVRGDALRLLGLEADAGNMYLSVASALGAAQVPAPETRVEAPAPEAAPVAAAPEAAATEPAMPLVEEPLAEPVAGEPHAQAAPAEPAPAPTPVPVEPPPLRWE